MELRKITKEEYGRCKALFTEAFPPEERLPFFLVNGAARRGRADFWCLYEAEKWVGIAYVICHKDLAYLFYFAIDAEQRGGGHGSAALAELKRQYAGRRLFLAIEQLDPAAENYAQRLSRHAFYERCGFHDIPHKLKEATVIYSLMGTGGAVQPEEYIELFDAFLGRFIRRLIDTRLME